MMTITLLSVAFVLASGMGLYEAYSKQRGVMGWIVSAVASVVGGIPVATMLPMGVISVLPQMSRDVNFYVFMTFIVIGLLIGSYLALWVVNRFR